LVTTIRLLALCQPASTGLSNDRVKLIGEREIERRNFRHHRDLRLERLTQPVDLGCKIGRPFRHRGEGNRTVLGHRPDKTRVLAEIKRQQRLARPQRRS
jgi:hypothetical protein